ncbi:MAG: hypothetical protein E6R04_01815 [Spirochaetes bacterium]|nr:MAG: hypothetical protein E6R04_01815 [Spirochaetota bacterium]
MKKSGIAIAFEERLQEFLKALVESELAEAGPPPLPPKKQPLPQGHEGDLQTPLGPNWETNNLEQDSQTVLRAFSDKLKKKGIDTSKLRKLGVGTMGVAYDLGDKVLKVTKDVREAQASSIVAGKTIPNIVQVYDIWKFPGVNWYGLIIEKLTPLSKEEEQQLTQTVINTKFPLLLHQAGDDWNKAMQALAQQTIKSLAASAYQQFPDADPSKGGQGMNDQRVAQLVRNGAQKTIQGFDKLTKQYNMRQLFKSLKSLGIQYYDFHGGNYGRRSDGTLVLFDLGRSISKGANPAELQEKFKLLEKTFGAPTSLPLL